MKRLIISITQAVRSFQIFQVSLNIIYLAVLMYTKKQHLFTRKCILLLFFLCVEMEEEEESLAAFLQRSPPVLALKDDSRSVNFYIYLMCIHAYYRVHICVEIYMLGMLMWKLHLHRIILHYITYY